MGPIMIFFFGARLSCGLQVALSVNVRAQKGQVVLLWLKLQESAIGLWTAGDVSLPFPHTGEHLQFPNKFRPSRLPHFPLLCIRCFLSLLC